ncbi:hypothetical protein L5515_016700 [Caenorhabditis briggsae]|uniref:Uncharacterized protein n=1 Tax=Caenorhabditis briggsae TaxID=6238 RepID=A0AAE9JQB1_CAEBR|nr:hypothetical protein L5515_016700 [Caenorhabditis briggsae]
MRIQDLAQQFPRIQALSAPVLPIASSGMPAGQEKKDEEPSPSDETPTTTRKRRASYSAPTTLQGGPEEEVQHDGSDDAQGGNEGPSTSARTDASSRRKWPRRGKLLEATLPPAR